MWPILSYCVASIMMTVVNKFVVSGSQFTMTFLRELRHTRHRILAKPIEPIVLTIQSVVCVACVYSVKRTGMISCTLPT